MGEGSAQNLGWRLTLARELRHLPQRYLRCRPLGDTVLRKFEISGSKILSELVI